MCLCHLKCIHIHGPKFGEYTRSFQKAWIKLYPGLVYCPKEDAAYCLPCALFSTDLDKRGQLVKEPFRNWKKATQQFDEHFHDKRHNSGDTSIKRKAGTGNKMHCDCVLRRDNFLEVMSGRKRSVTMQHTSALDEQKARNFRVCAVVW